MPYQTTALPSGKVRVTSPHGVKAKATTAEKAKKQIRLLNMKEHEKQMPKKKKKMMMKDEDMM